jgi:hypothetical protein
MAALAAGLPAAAALTLLRPWLHGAEPNATAALPPVGYATPALDASLVYRNTAGGAVVSIAPHELVVDSGPEGIVQIFLDDGTVLDDGFWTGGLPISPGDQAIASGAPYKGGLRAEKLWINAKNYIGQVLDLYDSTQQAPFRFRMRDRYDLTPYHDQHPEGHVVLVDPRTQVVGLTTSGTSAPSGVQYFEPIGGRRIELRVGQVVEAVGHDYQGVLQCVSLMP